MGNATSYSMAGEIASTKSMRLRYAGRCRVCDRELEAGASAIYERQTRTVLCLGCESERPSAVAPDAIATDPGAPAITRELAPEAEPFAGVAGGSAQREYERRRNARETRIRETHPKLGGLILALSDEPQTTKAWAIGAAGEERLGARLDGLTRDGVHVLHDRRIHGLRRISTTSSSALQVFSSSTRRNIAVAPAFAWKAASSGHEWRDYLSGHGIVRSWWTGCISR